MCKCNESNAKVIFRAIDICMSKYGIFYGVFVSLDVGNTSVNVDRYNSAVVDTRRKNSNNILMGCPCHIVHKAAKKAADAFSKLQRSSLEELCVDIYFHFDFSSKRKIFLTSVTRTIARF